MEETKELITINDIRSKVYIIRGQQVMLDKDLAEIYGYEVKKLNQQVKRNIERFPEDVMFRLSNSEIDWACEKTRVFSCVLLLMVIIIVILHKKGYSSPYPIRMLL